MDINIIFCRRLLCALRSTFRLKGLTHIRIMKDAWVWTNGRGHWEFHGPKDFLWYGDADNAYDARYKGWSAWLNKNYPDEGE